MCMKKIVFIMFFFIGTISANDDIWKPSSDYYLDCSYRTVGDIYMPGIVNYYVNYNLRDDKKIITTLYITDEYEVFSYQIRTAARLISDGAYHKFLLDNDKEWSISSSGVMEETKYTARDDERIRRINLDREKLTLEFWALDIDTCGIITAVQYKTAINNLENERDALIDNLIKERKSKVKL